ncbi:MAG: hypothetical protein WA942_18090 [Mycolicibacter sinensis]
MTDVGMRFVSRLHQTLGVDERWTVRHRRGFTWWGYWLAQYVEAGPVFESDGLDYCLVRIRTTIARDVSSAADPAGVLARLNRDATLSALIWNPHAGTIIECATALVTTVNVEQLCETLRTVAVLQCDSAHRRALSIARACDARIAVSAHPNNGERTDPDPLLVLARDEIVKAGAEPSRFAGALGNALGGLSSAITCSAGVGHTRLRCEVPYSGDTSVGTTQWATSPAGNDPQTALVRIFADQPHQQIGNGALSLLHLPVALGSSGAAVLTNHLNAVAAHGGVGAPLLGSWCANPVGSDRTGLVFCSFLPNALAWPLLLESHLIEQAGRARFALGQLGPAQVTAAVTSGPVTTEPPPDPLTSH